MISLVMDANHYVVAARDADLIAKLTKDEMVEFYNTFIHPKSTRRAKVTIQTFAQKSKEAESRSLDDQTRNNIAPILITDLKGFKATLPATAGPRPLDNKDLSDYMENDVKL